MRSVTKSGLLATDDTDKNPDLNPRYPWLGFLWWRYWLVVFPDFVNNLQLRTKLLIVPETNVVATLNHHLRIDGRQEDLGVRRQQIFTLVNRDPIVVDHAGGGGDRKVRWNLGGDLFESQHAIQFAIDPDAAT